MGSVRVAQVEVQADGFGDLTLVGHAGSGPLFSLRPEI